MTFSSRRWGFRGSKSSEGHARFMSAIRPTALDCPALRRQDRRYLKMREIALSPLDDLIHQSISVDLH